MCSTECRESIPGRPGIPVIFHSRIPGNGSASFSAKTETVQLTALLSFTIIAACSRDAPVPLQRSIDESLLDAVMLQLDGVLL